MYIQHACMNIRNFALIYTNSTVHNIRKAVSFDFHHFKCPSLSAFN